MSRDPALAGLSLDQAPPLSIPLTFFATAPVALAAAGALILASGVEALSVREAPHTMAAVHLGTLGFLAMVMIGALYQIVPVVGGAPIPHVRLAHAVHAILVAGAAVFVYGFATGGTDAFRVAGVFILIGLLSFFGAIAAALLRAPAASDSVRGMRLAVISFGLVFVLGFTMLLGRAGLYWIEDWGRWLLAHVGVGLVGWVGGLIAAVSWQVIPMFYLTAQFPRWARLASLILLALSLVAVLLALAFTEDFEPVLLALAPAGAAAWLVHPPVVAWLLKTRKRRRVGESVRFWWAAMISAPLAAITALVAFFGDEARWTVLFGWIALFGWAAMIVHGMLSRIIPFLVWFHRHASHIGDRPVPNMKDLLGDAQVRIGLVLHVATLIVGAIAIVSGVDLLARLAGLGLIATAVSVEAMLITTLRRAGAPASKVSIPRDDARTGPMRSPAYRTDL